MVASVSAGNLPGRLWSAGQWWPCIAPHERDSQNFTLSVMTRLSEMQGCINIPSVAWQLFVYAIIQILFHSNLLKIAQDHPITLRNNGVFNLVKIRYVSCKKNEVANWTPCATTSSTSIHDQILVDQIALPLQTLNTTWHLWTPKTTSGGVAHLQHDHQKPSWTQHNGWEKQHFSFCHDKMLFCNFNHTLFTSCSGCETDMLY